MRKLLTGAAVVLLLSAILSGCALIQPWERESMSSPIMIFDKDPIEKGIRLHHIEYREGSAGGEGSQSGGCGCG